MAIHKDLVKASETVPARQSETGKKIIRLVVKENILSRRQLLPRVEHRQSRYLNNRAENSHRPTRRRERQMQRFKSPGQAQDFLSAHAFIHGHFHPRRHLLTANAYRAIRTEAFKIWQQETCAQQVA